MLVVRSVPYDMSLLLVIDVRQIEKVSSDKVELKPYCWTVLPVFEQPPDQDNKLDLARAMVCETSFSLSLYDRWGMCFNLTCVL